MLEAHDYRMSEASRLARYRFVTLNVALTVCFSHLSLLRAIDVEINDRTGDDRAPEFADRRTFSNN